ncbi:hyaluronan-binding protein 2 [Salarias fasciatus]|uniref:hyaluronan-binding protein 2 n=1 Tax=Salarias fasciatus TaxID=181472 RepID=UPI001176E161|nr:hyaluronan-binding protein 2-like [Salarias fasciatus]
MLATGALLLLLSVHTVHGNNPNADEYCKNLDGDDYVDIPTDAPSVRWDFGDWLIDLLDLPTACDQNPCFNGGSCRSTSRTGFTCSCPEPYAGKRCQKVKNVCENAKCGAGDCLINLNKQPFYECKCRPPYQGPDCKTLPASPCQPNPCKNGGSCIKGNRRFRCACRNGFSGRLCGTAPTDCYVGSGADYRGVVSTTEEGIECLDWHSFFITQNGEDPYVMYSDFDGLAENYCRNPDGDEKPWCFIKKNGELTWDHCNVKKCSTAPAPPPTPSRPDAGPAQFSQCGKSQPLRTSRIHGGRKSFPGAHPWQVSLQMRDRGSNGLYGHKCGGILISSCWVLTAAHCILPNKEYQVVLGGVNLQRQEEMDQTIPVIQTIVHENYRSTSAAVYNDIALLKLKVTDSPYCAKETRFVRTACLPDRPFPAGKECVISGWGATEAYSYSPQLLNARVFLISEDRCKTPQIYGNRLDSSMLCAGILQGGVDSCQGDSGGPLVCEQDGTHYVTGVVSWGQGCAERNKPGVYANVHTFLNWIKSKMN